MVSGFWLLYGLAAAAIPWGVSGFRVSGGLVSIIFWGWRYLVPFRGFAVTAVVLDLVRPRLLLLEPIIPGAA